jgi:hypothetical protein
MDCSSSVGDLSADFYRKIKAALADVDCKRSGPRQQYSILIGSEWVPPPTQSQVSVFVNSAFFVKVHVHSPRPRLFS